MKRLGALFLMVSAVTAGTAHAANYYVAATGGVDSRSCATAQNVATPKRTITSGLACLSGGGDTLLIRTGTYDETITNGIPSGTSWSSKVRIANYNGEPVWLRPSAWALAAVFLYGSRQQYIEFDGINVDASLLNNAMSFGGADGSNPHHIRVQNAEIISGFASHSAGGINVGAHVVEGAQGGFELLNLTIHGGVAYGIYLMAPNSVIDGCNIYDVGFAGIHVYNGGGDDPDNNVIRNCKIHDITRSYWFGNPDPRSAGIILSGADNQIYNNVIYRINTGNFTSGEDVAISLYNTTRARIWNNTITGNNQDCISVGSGSANSDIRNNICYGNAGSAFVNAGSGTVQSNNLLNVDPSFVNPSANDFQLGNGSRAVDAGIPLSFVTTDIVGTPRSQGVAPDIGAFEYRGGQVAAPAPPTNVRIVSR